MNLDHLLEGSYEQRILKARAVVAKQPWFNGEPYRIVGTHEKHVVLLSESGAVKVLQLSDKGAVVCAEAVLEGLPEEGQDVDWSHPRAWDAYYAAHKGEILKEVAPELVEVAKVLRAGAKHMRTNLDELCHRVRFCDRLSERRNDSDAALFEVVVQDLALAARSKKVPVARAEQLQILGRYVARIREGR